MHPKTSPPNRGKGGSRKALYRKAALKSVTDTSSLGFAKDGLSSAARNVALLAGVSSINHKASPPLRNEGGVKRCDSTEQTPLAPYEGKLSLSRQDERRIELGVPFETDIDHKASPPQVIGGGFSQGAGVRSHLESLRETR